MSDVQRWALTMHMHRSEVVDASLVPDDDGDYILYTDYLRDTVPKVCRWTRIYETYGFRSACGKGIYGETLYCPHCGGKVAVL